jgi:hypothetical protein
LWKPDETVFAKCPDQIASQVSAFGDDQDLLCFGVTFKRTLWEKAYAVAPAFLELEDE